MADAERDTDLVERAVGGDQAALERLLLSYYDRLARRMARRLPAGLRATVSEEDILQQTFIGAFDGIERFELGRSSGKTYIRSTQRPIVFEVPDRVLTDVPRDLFAYRDKQVLSFDEDAAARVELEFPRDEASYALVQHEGSWQLEENEGELDSFRIDDLLYALHQLEAIALEVRSPTLAELGLVPPRVRVRVLAGDGAVLGQLELGDPTADEGTAARSTRTDRLWRVDNAVGQDVPLTPEAFRTNFFEEPAEDDDPDPQEEAEGLPNTPPL